MAPRPSLSIICISLLSYSCNMASSMHIHRHIKHRHLHRPRQITTPNSESLPPTPTTLTSMSSIVTEGNEVTEDIEDIQSGLTDLPQNLLEFIQAAEDRLEQLEDILASLLAGPTGPSPSMSSETMALASASTYPPLSEPPAPFPSDFPASSSTSPPSLTLWCHPPSGAGPLVPCQSTNGIVTYTNTSTAYYTKTTYVSYASGITPTPIATTAPFVNSSTTAATGTSPMIPANSTSITYPFSPTASAYVFDADAEDNVAVYYGTTPNTKSGGLLELCENPNVDIVILSFVYDFFGQNRYPTMNFGPGCSEPNAAQRKHAPGLMDCTSLASEVTGCQATGKKVLVSLGGYTANTTLTSASEAEQLSQTLWDLFGGGSKDPALRPFGPDVILDGFDIDNEEHDPTHYTTFTRALRHHLDSDKSKPYYLSAALQCPLPDASIPLPALALADFVWVQFYNNPACNLDSDGFEASFSAWSADLTRAAAGTPRLYIGAGAFEGAGSGYVQGSELASRVGLARGLYVGNLGGVMLWDGSMGLGNVDGFGVDYLSYAKAALQV